MPGEPRATPRFARVGMERYEHLTREQIAAELEAAHDRIARLEAAAELALRESGASLRAVFRAAPTGIGLVVDRVVKQVNERLCAMTGYAEHELIGRIHQARQHLSRARLFNGKNNHV